ncbi:unnamed protein product [Rhodiola kirilowii]
MHSGAGLIVLCLAIIPTVLLFAKLVHILATRIIKRYSSSGIKLTNVTPISSLLEIKVVRLPAQVIFDAGRMRFDPPDMAQIPKVRLGEGMLGTLFKIVLNCGTIVTMRKLRDRLASRDEVEDWVKFFGEVCKVEDLMLPIEFGFWYGGEAFVLYPYECMGSLEELLHGSKIYKALNCELRLRIALCAAEALASIHSRCTPDGEALICGVIKSSNVMIGIDFSARMAGYETPYLISPAIVIRRNHGRMAPELLTARSGSRRVFTTKSDVYSFGVLLLEILTGEKPAMTNLVESVGEKIGAGVSIVDEKLGNVEESAGGFLRIAQLCLAVNPAERPSMKKVVEMIQML